MIINGFPLSWICPMKSLVDYLLSPPRSWPHSLQSDFILFGAVLFECLWRKRTNIIHENEKNLTNDFYQTCF